MVFVPIVLLALGADVVLAVSSATTSNTLCKGGIPATVASVLANYQPASSYCSSRFPVPAKTTTLTAAITTVIVSAPTSVTTTTTSTTSTTTYDSTITSLSVVIETDTAMTTITITSAELPVKKRYLSGRVNAVEKRAVYPAAFAIERPNTSVLPKRAAAINPACTSAFSNLKSRESAFVGSVCTCLEVQPTSTVYTTPTTTKTVTPLSTSSVTRVITIHTTSSTTTTTTSTTVTTATATAIITPTYACSGTPGTSCTAGVQFTNYCDTIVSVAGSNTPSAIVGASSGTQCLDFCATDPTCNIFQFLPTSATGGTCNLFVVPGGIALVFTPSPGAYSGRYSNQC